MPWDGTELWVGHTHADGSVGHWEKLAGGLEESIYQPEWSSDGLLYFSSDRTGWWNLYRWRYNHIESLYPMEAEFGLPQWEFGTRTFVFESPDRMICAYTKNGLWNLASLDLTNRALKTIETPISHLLWGNLATKNGKLFLIGGSATEPSSVVQIDLSSNDTKILHRSREVTVNKDYFSIPSTIEFPTENGRTAFAFFYPPNNPDYESPEGEKPPLLVVSHGGPHNSESRYLDKLVGPYPERRDVYRARSPIDHTDGISSALILFQGLEDKVVPPNQSEKIFQAVKAKGLPVAYIAYEWEQHGFRRAENIKRSNEAELYFYSKIFQFSLAEKIEPVKIENLSGRETKPTVQPVEISKTV